MRILLAAVIAAFFTAGSLAAYAQTTAPATPAAPTAGKVKCRKRAEADCKAPDCTWTPGADASTPGKCSKSKK
ncbi:MAG: hypothetical protein ACLPWS_06425 [Rhodomicrobium sp.]